MSERVFRVRIGYCDYAVSLADGPALLELMARMRQIEYKSGYSGPYVVKELGEDDEGLPFTSMEIVVLTERDPPPAPEPEPPPPEPRLIEGPRPAITDQSEEPST